MNFLKTSARFASLCVLLLAGVSHASEKGHAPTKATVSEEAKPSAKSPSQIDLNEIQALGLSGVYSFEKFYSERELKTLVEEVAAVEEPKAEDAPDTKKPAPKPAPVDWNAKSRARSVLENMMAQVGCESFNHKIRAASLALSKSIKSYGATPEEARMYFFSEVRDASKKRFSGVLSETQRVKIDESLLLLFDSMATLDPKDTASSDFKVSLARSLKKNLETHFADKGEAANLACGTDYADHLLKKKLAHVKPALEGAEPRAHFESLVAQGVSSAALDEALKSYEKHLPGGKITSPYMVVMDLQPTASTQRFWAIDIRTGKVLRSFFVAHGSGSGLGVRNPNNQLKFLSNKPGSNASTWGAMLMNGFDPTSAKDHATELIGLDEHNLKMGNGDWKEGYRSIKIHAEPRYFYPPSGFGSDAMPEAVGRSSGCPVAYPEDAKWIVDNIPAGSFMYAHAGGLPVVETSAQARAAMK